MLAGMVLLHLHKLLCSAVIFCFLMKKWQVHVISLGMCLTTGKQLFRCTATAYLSCSLSSQNASNGSPTQGLHMRLYTWWPRTLHLTTNWLLGVTVVLGPSAMFTFMDFGALFFEKWNGPPPPPAPLSPSSKLGPPTCIFSWKRGGVRINRVYGLLEIMWYFFSCDSKEAYKPR